MMCGNYSAMSVKMNPVYSNALADAILSNIIHIYTTYACKDNTLIILVLLDEH